MLRITHVISNIDRSAAFEWLVEGMPPESYRQRFLLLNPVRDSYLQEFLRSRGIAVETILLRNRYDYPRVFLRLLWEFLSHRPDIVHTQLVGASLLGMPAAFLAGIPRRILTRHHSTFHHKFAPHFVKYDRLVNRLATAIIAVSRNVRDVLVNREGVDAGKVTLIHNSFDFSAFEGISEERITAVRKRHDLEKPGPVVGVISRFIRWKGIQFIIPAFERLLKSYPEAILVLANADGPDADWIRPQLRRIPEKNLRLIPFERDVFALYRTFDLFVHVPIDGDCEAHGQVYVEALASGIPSVFTLSGVAAEFVKDGENALVVGFQDSDGILLAMEKILSGGADKAELIRRGRESVRPFACSRMLENLRAVYEKEGG